MSAIRRISHEQWTAVADGCWALGPQELCWNPLQGAQATMVILQGAHHTWLIDAGTAHALKRFKARRPPDITDILITHAHPDHVHALGDYPAAACWISNANPAAWQQTHYMRSHWQRYCSVCNPSSHLCRSVITEHFQDLQPIKDCSETMWQDLVIEQLLRLSQCLYPNMERPQRAMQHLEQLPLQEVFINGVTWQGWDFGELKIIPTRGHAPDHVVAWWQPTDLWVVGDELAAVPVWTDSDQCATMQFQQKLLHCLRDSTLLIGGHQSACFCDSQAIQSMLTRFMKVAAMVETASNNSTNIDLAYSTISEQTWFQPLLKAQFPHTVFFAKQFIANWVLKPTRVEPATHVLPLHLPV